MWGIIKVIGLLVSCSSSRWDSHFHHYVLTIYVCLYWLWELVVFYFLVRKRYIRKVSVQLVPKYFPRACSTGSISCSERKKTDENNITDSKVAPLSNRCRTAVAPLSLCWCCSCCCYAVTPAIASAVAPLPFCCRSTITPLSLRCCCAIVQLSLRCRSDAALMSLLSLRCRCCRFCCRYAVTAALHFNI